MTFLIFIPRNAAQIKSKQFHHLHRTSLILTAQQNTSCPGKGGQKGTIKCLHQKPHTTTMPGFQIFAPTKKKEDYQTSKTEKAMKKIPKSNPTCKQILVLSNTWGKQKSKEIKVDIWCNPDTIITWNATIPAGFLTLLSCKQSKPWEFFSIRANLFSPILFYLIAINYSDL